LFEFFVDFEFGVVTGFFEGSQRKVVVCGALLVVFHVFRNDREAGVAAAGLDVDVCHDVSFQGLLGRVILIL
jgi:hypothetical protein